MRESAAPEKKLNDGESLMGLIAMLIADKFLYSLIHPQNAAKFAVPSNVFLSFFL